MNMAKAVGLTGLTAWALALPWVQLVYVYGQTDQSVPQWAFVLVVATLAVMSVSVPAWFCSLCMPALRRWQRFMLPGVLFGAAFYGWISLSAVAQLGTVQGLWSVAVMLSPLLVTGLLLVSVPLAWRQAQGGSPPFS